MSIQRTLVIAVVFTLFCLLPLAVAQQTSTSETVPGQATAEETVRSGEVVAVDGNDLFVRTDDGQVKHFVIPPDFKFNIDGKEVSVSELTPGTKLSQTIKTTRTPQTVRTVTSIKGRVWQVNPPKMVILTMPDGTNKQYTIPEGQKFNVGGQQVDAFALRKGMNIDATVVQNVPEEVVSEQRAGVTGTAPAPPPEPVQTAQAQEPAPPAPPAEAPPAQKKELPQTASPLPLLGLFGVLSVTGSLVLRRLGLGE